MSAYGADVTIGFVPLTDSAPLVIAKEKGFFSKYGLTVELSRENSWSQIRDKLAYQEIDAAHMLAPMVPASWLDTSYSSEKFVTALSLNLNGNAITVSNRLYGEMLAADPDAMSEQPVTARALRQVIANRIEQHLPAPVIGTVFPYSSHNYAVRYWLGAEGIHPDRDVQLMVAPPPFMVEQLKEGIVDAFCVGEPWNTVAEYLGLGRAIVKSSDIWRHMPEKVLGVRQKWAEQNPDTHILLVQAVLEALQWLDDGSNRLEAVHILSSGGYVGVSPALLSPALLGRGVLDHRRSLLEGDDVMIFNHYTANFPWRSHALWFLSQMLRWGQIQEPVDLEQIAANCYLPNVYRAAADILSLPYPLADDKMEGQPDRSWILSDASQPIAMPSSRFIDGHQFNPSHLPLYLEKFFRHNLRVNLSDL